ncbi:DUF6644 family protein [Sphingomonas bacterium]|uniref:DUF6644 family protein n=1 Tax=Sphingomonas bacterium TaxID=1895847 RepID=UPI00157755BF|nr:DUF6644 family protein [Sphingomonas bacterium]
MSTMRAASDWLSQTHLSSAIADRFWAVPTLQSIHIVAIGIVMSSIALLDLRLAGFLGREQSMRDLTLRFYPWIWGALAVLVVTGLLQIMAEPGRELLNWIFWTKMGLIVGAVLFTAPVRRLLEDCRFRDLSAGKRAVVRTCALLSLAMWMMVLICGRWIAYAGAPA